MIFSDTHKYVSESVCKECFWFKYTHKYVHTTTRTNTHAHDEEVDTWHIQD